MAANPKLLSRVGNYLRGGPTEREESRTAVLQEVEDDLAGDGYGVNEELIPGSLAPITPDEKRDSVVSKHEDNDNYESYPGPKGDPYRYELFVGDSRETSYILATKDGKSVKIWADKMPEVFDTALSYSPSAAEAGFGKAPASGAVPDYGESDSGLRYDDREPEQKPSYGESDSGYGESPVSSGEKVDPFAAGKKINSASGKGMQGHSRVPLGGAKGADKKAQELRYAQSHPYGRELHAAKVSKLKRTSS
tara:strand:+ start:2137 stop:2886 length:750 start_codon:yes stop_codon:yes gene_type:complete